MTGAIEREGAEQVLRALGASEPGVDGRYDGRLAVWLADVFAPALCAAAGEPACRLEGAALTALAGPPSMATSTTVTWDGEPYLVAPAVGARRATARVRGEQGGFSLDTAADLRRVGAMLQAAASAEQLRAAAGELAATAQRLSDRRSPGPARLATPDVPGELGRLARALGLPGGDPVRRASEAAARVLQLTDEVCADALVAAIYAGTTSSSRNPLLRHPEVPRRHAFALGIHPQDPWLLARPFAGPGQPWQLVGTLLSLDVALAVEALRPSALDEGSPVPTVDDVTRAVMAQHAAVSWPRHVRGADGREAVGALAAGRGLVASLAVDPARVDEVAARAALSPWRREALRWRLAGGGRVEPEAFTRIELVRLGLPQGRRLPAVLVLSVQPIDGRLTPRQPAAVGLEWYADRPGTGIALTQFGDLHVRVLELLAKTGLPAQLLPSVLAPALFALLAQVEAGVAEDWAALARAVDALTDDRIADAVSTLTLDGPLVPVGGGGDRP